MEYGYTRISTPQQSIERQKRNIKAFNNNAVIIEEVFTGTTLERKEFQKLLSTVKENDTIIFDSVSRMSRNAEEGFTLYKELYNKGVNLIFLKERHIDTSVYKKALENQLSLTNTNIDFILDGINKYLMELAKEQIKLAFEQSAKEVKDLRQRTKEGIETARLNGKQIGNVKGSKRTTKKEIAAIEQIIKYSKDFKGTLNDIECIKIIGISRNSYYKYKNKIKENV